MEESVLPEFIRRKAAISLGGEYAWRLDDVEEVITIASNLGLACLGGQAQFQTPEGTCEAYWLNYDSQGRQAGEPWQNYVSRTANEVRSRFHRMCQTTDFRKVAYEWELMRTKMDFQEYDPINDLWFICYFEKEQVA